MLYVVNFSNDDGYAILGADSRLDTVLIVGDTGNFALPLFGSPTSPVACFTMARFNSESQSVS